MTSPVDEVAGGGGATSIVLLHSLGTDRRLWRHQVAPLSELGPVVTPETRGHGEAAWDGSTSIDQWVDDLLPLVCERRPVDLVGLSMGGMQAVAFAAAHPELVRSLTVANAFASLPEEVADARVSAAAEGIDRLGMGGYADKYLADTLTQPIPEADRVVLRDAIAQMSPEAYRGSVEAVFRGDVSDALAAVRCPTLVIAAKQDQKTPYAALDRIATGIAGAQIIELDDAGHLSCIENPAAFNEALSRFLTEVRSASQPTNREAVVR